MQLCSSLSILWHCLSLGLEWKLTFSSPVATAELSIFAGILSAALSQHHLLGGAQFSSVAQLCPTLCDSMNCSTPGLPSPGVHSNSRPSSRWCHPAISSSVVPFSSCPQFLPHRSLFQWVNSSDEVESIGVSALASFLPKNTQGWPPLGRWKIQEMDDSESCTTMWMYLVSLNYTVKYG